MEPRISVVGPGERMTFKERARWAWSLQKEVARIVGISKWGPALKGKMEIESDEVFPLILRQAKSVYNRKSIMTIRYEKIPDDLHYELSSYISFGGPFVISYSGGADPLGEYGKYSNKNVSVDFVDESKISRKVLLGVFRFLIQSLNATEASFTDSRYRELFRDKTNTRQQDGDRVRIARYMWTGLLTFLPNDLRGEFDLSMYNYTTIGNHGVIVSMEGVEDAGRIMDFNRKVAALHGAIID